MYGLVREGEPGTGRAKASTCGLKYPGGKAIGWRRARGNLMRKRRTQTVGLAKEKLLAYKDFTGNVLDTIKGKPLDCSVSIGP